LTSNEVQNLILQVQGKEKLDGLNTALRAEQQLLQDLVRQQQQGVGINPAQIEAAAEKVVILNGELKALTGRPGMGGQGILQASWAVQDFTSVLSGGQGLGRALSSIQNNIPGLLMSLGMTGGVAGAVSLISVGIGALMPVLEGLWKSLESDTPKQAREKFEKLKDEIKRTHEAFLKLTEAATPGEETEASEVTRFLRERPHADAARRAAVEGMGAKSTEAAVAAAGTRDEWAGLAGAAGMSDEAIEKAAANAAFGVSRSGAPPGQAEAAADETRTRLRGERAAARSKRFELERAAKEAAAEKMLAEAQVAGPAGDAARRDLRERAAGVEGLEGLADTTESAIMTRRQAAGLEAARKVVQEQIKRADADREKRMIDEAHNLGRGEANQAKDLAERRKREAAALKERTDREIAAEPELAREARMQSARKGIGQMGAAMDAPPIFDAKQVDEMASQALANVDQGMTAQAALFSSIVSKMTEMNRRSGQFTAQLQQYSAWMNNMQMGGDNSGRGSNLPAMMGAGGR
jgi:hypothetical protein